MKKAKPFPDAPRRGHLGALDDAERLRQLQSTGLVGSLPEEAFDRAVRLATQIAGAPVGLVSLVTGDIQFFKAHRGLTGTAAAERQTPLSHSFCQYVVSEDDTLAVSDARLHPLLKGSGAVSDLGVVAYLGVPIHGPSGGTLGAFCAIDTEPREWTDDVATALRDVAATVEAEIALRQTIEEKQMLLKEFDHRVKNTFAIIASMISLSARNVESADHLARSLRDRVHALAEAHAMISPSVAAVDQEAQGVPLQHLISTLVLPYGGGDAARVTMAGPQVTLGPRGCQGLTLAVHELATNAAKYGAFSAPDGRLSIRWETDGDALKLMWSERSSGFEVQPASFSGFGTKLIDMSVKNLRGSIERTMSEQGLECVVSLSLAEALT